MVQFSLPQNSKILKGKYHKDKTGSNNLKKVNVYRWNPSSNENPRIDTFEVKPDEGGPFPGIIIYMDAPAIREELRDMARRLASMGYYVLLPNLFYRVGIGTIDNAKLKAFASSRSNAFMSYIKSKIRKPDAPNKDIDKEEITSKYDMLVFGKEEERLNYTLANCCNPIPGDKVFGFVTINDGIKVHKKNCPNALSM